MHEDLIAVQESTVAGLGRLAGFFGFSEVMGATIWHFAVESQTLVSG